MSNGAARNLTPAACIARFAGATADTAANHMLRVTIVSDGEPVSTHQLSARMLALKKPQVTVGECRACQLCSLLDSSILEVLTSPIITIHARDGSYTECAFEDLQCWWVAYAFSDGDPLPAKMGGPLLGLFSAGKASSIVDVKDMVALHVRGSSVAAPAAAFAAPAAAPAADSEALAPAPAADVDEWVRLKDAAAGVVEAEKAAAAAREADRHRDVDNALRYLAVGIASVVALLLAVALAPAMRLIQ
jgi:hypothetical protein